MNSILLINEDSKILSILKEKIARFIPNHEVFVAMNGIEGIELAKRKDPGVIILGANNENPKSITVCEKLKAEEQTKDIPLVFLTSDKVDNGINIEAVNAGIDAFLSKPIDDVKLALKIKTMLKLKRDNNKCREESVELKNQVEKRTVEFQKELNKRKEFEDALRESEKRYRMLVENQNDLLVKFDRDKKMLYVNPNYCDYFGIIESDILGKSFFPLIHENNVEVMEKSINMLKIPPHKSYHEERDKTINGWKWVGWSKRAVVNEKGEIIEVVSVGRDITERKELEQKLKEHEAKLLELNATKDKFFSIIAHDLRGPFNGILGFSELIAEKCENNDFKDVGKMSMLLNKSAKQSFDLLTNLLEWSRTQQGKKQFEPKHITLIPLLKKEVELVSLSAKEKDIAFKCDCPDTTVFADYNMLQTIIRNLVSNAIKYCNIGGEILISVQQNNEEVQISVRDNGIGMSDEKLKKLFNIGEVESTPGTNREKGTGLGLILCKEFVEQHGGKIWVESYEGGGSIFSFSLPCQ